MTLLSRIKSEIPIVYPLPIRTLIPRLLEKIHHFKRRHSMLAAKEVGADDFGNVILKLRKNCDVGKKGLLVKAPRDLMIFEYLKNLGSWAQEEPDFLAAELSIFREDILDSSVILDLGANVGLTSMQISRKVKSSPHFILVEPLKMHIEALKFNLSNTSEICSYEVCEFALAENSGHVMMRIDEMNRGSSQIVKDFGQNEFDLENVLCLGIAEFADKYLMTYQNIFLKSDLEGHDVEVLGNLQPKYWDNIRAGVVEVIPRESQDNHAFWKLLGYLETFSCVTWDINNRIKLSSEEISRFWLGGDKSLTRNLFFSRRS